MSVIQSIEDGRKQDGNRSIADKIIKGLHDLEKTVENNHGRWAWELLQNAKDSVADDYGSVSVQIIFDEDSIEFKHNGTHFTEQDIRGLINQISSKENEEGVVSRKVGKFGTGFLTTHLLSRVIEVEGIVETVNGEFFSFKFPLDREGKTTTLLAPKVENAWTEFFKSTKKVTSLNPKKYNTCFRYKLGTEDQQRIAKVGIVEFTSLIPYVLAFNDGISSVEIIERDFIEDQTTTFTCEHNFVEPSILNISKVKGDEEEIISILFASDEKVAVAVPLAKTKGGYSISKIKETPKLFCDFPLIGTEDFYFPVVVNSFYFNPLTERDGIWLKGNTDPEVKENQSLLLRALKLYKDILTLVSEKKFSDLFNLVDSRIPDLPDKYFDKEWYRTNIQKPLRDTLLLSKVVETENGGDAKKPLKETWFPSKSYSQEVREKIWQFTFDQFPEAVCKKTHIHSWSELSWDTWNKLDYNEIVSDVSNNKSIEKLSEALRIDEFKTFQWINNLGTFLLAEESNLPLFDKYAILPNQNNIFKLKSTVFIDKINDSELIKVLSLLGEDWKDILLHKKVGFGRYAVKEKKDIALLITEKLKKPGNDEKTIEAINLLSEWFENNKDEGKELFTELYRKRAELFMNTIVDKESLYKVMRSKTDLSKLSKVADAIEENPDIIDNLDNAEEITNLLKKYKVTSIKELEDLIKSGTGGSTHTKIEINQETLVSLGISSPEEFERIFKNTKLYEKFVHNSSRSPQAYQYAQKIIKRAKKNIIAHLETLDEYDCSGCDEVAPSIFGGILKNGNEVFIVARPSDNGEVIIYYPSEVATLEFAESELWYEDGSQEPAKLTLGQIFKNTGINRIPV